MLAVPPWLRAVDALRVEESVPGYWAMHPSMTFVRATVRGAMALVAQWQHGWSVRVRATSASLGPGRLSVRVRSLLGGVARRVRTGDRDFDARVAVTSDRPAWCRLLLDDPTRAALARAIDRDGVEPATVAVEHGAIEASVGFLHDDDPVARHLLDAVWLLATGPEAVVRRWRDLAVDLGGRVVGDGWPLAPTSAIEVPRPGGSALVRLRHDGDLHAEVRCGDALEQVAGVPVPSAISAAVEAVIERAAPGRGPYR